MQSLKQNLFLYALFALLGFPLFYYAYKFGTPEFGGLDVYSYYKLYTNWDFAAVDSPFNQRIISSYAIYLIHQSGISYNTETAITALGLDQQVYFSALLFNYLCVVGTCLVIYHTIRAYVVDRALLAFTGGMIFFFGFGTLFFLITAASDALSVLLVAMIFWFYLRKSLWLIPLLVLSVFQREYIFFIFGLMAFVHWFADKPNRKYYAIVVAANIACFFIYFICRKTIFFTPRFEHQIDITRFFDMISHSIQDLKAYMRQTFMLQNLLILYVGLCLYKLYRRIAIDKVYLLIVLLLLVEIVIMSLLIGLGNNTGRYYYMITPVVVFLIVKEAYSLHQGEKARRATT